MIDLTNAQPAGNIDVTPSDAIFTELGHNTYDYKDLISELVDNSIAAKVPNGILEITINIFVDQDNQPLRFIITDNAAGIPADRLGLAISPAGIRSENSLNEHGLGMKQAVAALGRLDYLATKTQNEEMARIVREFRFGKIDVQLCNADFNHGTEIAVTHIRPIVDAAPINYTRTLVPYLGARYRRFLRHEAPLMTLVINRRTINTPHSILNTWTVREEKPIYFHPGDRTNRPVINNFPIRSDDNTWEARLTFGYAPHSSDEYAELGIEIPSKFHPYHVSLSKQGLDIIRNERVIIFAQLAEIGLVTARHNDYNDVRGEIDLVRGFSTATTKNAVINDRAFKECVSKIRDVLTGQIPGPRNEIRNYLERKSYPEDIPEKLLRDRLADWLMTNPLQPRKEASKEFVVEGIEGYIDVKTETEAFELKTDLAKALDVYQLFMYMDKADIDNGFLVAPDHSPGAKVAAQFIERKHHKRLQLARLDQFPINNPPNAEEREEYY